MGEGNSKQSKVVPYDYNEKKKNTLNELQILEGHTDIVRIVLKIDDMRYYNS